MKKGDTAFAITCVIILGIGVFNDWSLILTCILAFVIGLIIGVIVECIFESKENKRNKKYTQIVKANKRYEGDRKISEIMSQDKYYIKDLFSFGALLLCCNKDNNPVLAITANGGVTASGFVAKENLHPKIYDKNNEESYTTTKKASATKRAIAGGVLAGGVGAVVGAVSANEANANGGVTHTRSSSYKTYYLEIYNNKFESYRVSKDMFDKYGKPDLTKFTIKSVENFYQINGPFTTALKGTESNELNLLYDIFTKIIP